MNLYDSIANLVLFQIGSIVFLSIEAYAAAKSTGELETKVEEQSRYIIKLFYDYEYYKEKLKRHGIDQDIAGSEEPDKDLIPGPRESRELGARNFISEFSLFGSNIASILNSLVIWLELFDPITAIIASAIPATCWLLTRGKSIDQMRQNILSYIAISSIVGQIAYFGAYFGIERSAIAWTLDGLIPFFVGFSLGLFALIILTGDNYRIIIRALYNSFRLKWTKYNPPESAVHL